MSSQLKLLIGELAGTALLVFFGTGSVAAAVFHGAFSSLFEVALFWGVGIAIAILSVWKWCPAHLNPAVTLAMCISGHFEWRKAPLTVVFQFIGAFIGSLLVYLLFKGSIADFETANGIVRGSQESIKSAMAFGEFFPNPDFAEKVSITMGQAILAESIGTGLMVLVIFRLTQDPDKINALTALLIGLTVTLLITIIAPFTQAGFNPARDLSPRMVAYFMGWNDAAFPTPSGSWFFVYVAGPLLGGGTVGVYERWRRSQATS
ncbi:MAG: aquaporin family protein [Flavobacteriales bacterium]|nr:aquaporin family protein [Flavobacteriales bacterium]